jgi:hypothetical protein
MHRTPYRLQVRACNLHGCVFVVRPERARRQEARLSTCGFVAQAARYCEAIRASENQPAWRRYSKTVSGSFPGGTTSR